MHRDFKGIWIPREIWLAKDLNCQEKCLWAEIHSLFDRESSGCYATNEYLMEFFGIKERRLQEMLANLKHKGWIVQVSFDGRSRVIKAVVPPEDFKPEPKQDFKRAGQRCGKVHLSDAEKRTPEMQDSAPPSIYIEQIRDPIGETPRKSPPVSPGAGAPTAAIAACDDDFSPKKPKRVKSDFSPLVRDVTAKLLQILIDDSPSYIPPKNLRPFLDQVRLLLEEDKRDPEKLYHILRQTVANNPYDGPGLFVGNPFLTLRKKFVSLEKRVYAKSEGTKKDASAGAIPNSEADCIPFNADIAQCYRDESEDSYVDYLKRITDKSHYQAYLKSKGEK